VSPGTPAETIEAVVNATK